MNIAFLDIDNFQKAHEQFDYSAFEALGKCHYSRNTSADLIAGRAKNMDILVVLKTELPADILKTISHVKLICKIGSGFDRIDIKAARELGILVSTFPGHAAELVAQWTLSLIYALANNILLYDQAVKSHQWQAAQFSYPITAIKHSSLGIIGYGSIGKLVAELAIAIGMKVYVHTNYPVKHDHIEFVDKEFIYRNADFISLHCHLNSDTRNMINETIFDLMKPECYLINTARAALVDKDSLLHALKTGKIRGAALDGYWKEPPDHNDPLLSLPNIIVTPHVGWAAHSTRQILLNEIARCIGDFIHGKPIQTITQ